MRIALLAPLISTIAPPFLGGAQALLADLAVGLVARGHDVTLYAADGSDVPGVRLAQLDIDPATLRPARFMETSASAVSDEPSPAAADDDDDDEDLGRSTEAFLRAYRVIAAHASEHDLVHAHAYDWPALALASLQPLPVAHTLHLPAVDARINRALATIAPPDASTPTRIVTVSRACAATYASTCRIDAVIYNGIDSSRIPFNPTPFIPTTPARDDVTGEQRPYLLYAGRIAPEKGVEDALEIAAGAGYPLVLAGGVYDGGYYTSRIAPRLDATWARYLGLVSRERLWELMAGAVAVLCPVHWDEPFGLVACEAQATGTPVIGYARGGLVEVVADGETGRLVAEGDIAAAVAAVARVSEFDRVVCRRRIERLFSLDAMLDAYEAFFRGMLAV